MATRNATRIYQFITKNLVFFHLRLKQSLREHQKFSKYYDHGCLENFLLHFMSLLTVSTVKNSHILAVTQFIFLKEGPRPNSKTCNTRFGPQRKDRKSSYHVRQLSALFCNLVALILGSNCAEVLRVTKIVKEIKFEGAWGKLDAKTCFPRQPRAIYLKKTLVFMRNSVLRENFNFSFQEVFCQY